VTELEEAMSFEFKTKEGERVLNIGDKVTIITGIDNLTGVIVGFYCGVNDYKRVEVRRVFDGKCVDSWWNLAEVE